MLKGPVTKVLIVLALLALPAAGTARADAYSDFETAKKALDDGKFDVAIHYFTKAIQSGELSDDNLAFAFSNRDARW